MMRSLLLVIVLSFLQLRCSGTERPDTHIKKADTTERVITMSFSAVEPTTFAKTGFSLDVHFVRQIGNSTGKVEKSEKLELKALQENEKTKKLVLLGKRNGDEFTMAFNQNCDGSDRVSVALEKSIVHLFVICSKDPSKSLKVLIETVPLDGPAKPGDFVAASFHSVVLSKEQKEIQFKAINSAKEMALLPIDDFDPKVRAETLESSSDKVVTLEAK